MARRSALLGLVLALLLAAPGFAEIAGDLGGAFTPVDPDAGITQEAAPVDMTTADVVIGYVAPQGAYINPFRCTEQNLISVNQLVFESVVDLDENLKPAPMLADSWTHDGRTWVFKLRAGIRFHNGQELTAYDVVRSYDTILQAGERNPYYGRLQAITNMEATDILELTVTSRNGGLSTLYAMVFPVVQFETLTDDLPRGTGPYWFIQLDMDGTLRLEANPLWWKRQPGVHSILLRRFDDSGDAIEALQTNRITMLATNSVHASLSRRLSDLTSLDYTTLTYEMLVPNLSSGSLMSDLRIRQAVMYAIDRSLLASNAYVDMAVQCEVPIQPNSWLYESQSAVYYHSPERALALMYEAGWRDMTGNGKLNRMNGIMLEEPNLTIATYNESTNSIRENAAEMIAGYLEALGFNVTVVVESKSKIREHMRERKYDLFLIGVNLSELPNLSSLLSSGGSLNYSHWSSDEMELLLSRAAYVADEATLKKVYSDIQLVIVEKLPFLGLLFRTGTVLSSRPLGGMSGLRLYDTFNGFEFLAMN